jgi:hypothetical protein
MQISRISLKLFKKIQHKKSYDIVHLKEMRSMLEQNNPKQFFSTACIVYWNSFSCCQVIFQSLKDDYADFFVTKICGLLHLSAIANKPILQLVILWAFQFLFRAMFATVVNPFLSFRGQIWPLTNFNDLHITKDFLG